MKIGSVVRLVGLALGLAVFSYWIYLLGPDRILDVLLNLKGWMLLVLANSFLWQILYTEAWRVYFSNLTHTIPFWHLFKVKTCGEAVNLMTPFGFVAGDPVRVLLLQKQFGTSTRLGSVLVDRLLHSLATVSFVLVGLAFTFWHRVLITSEYRWVGLAIYALGVAVLAWLVYDLVKGYGFARVHRLLVRLRLNRRIPKLDDRILNLNAELAGFSQKSLKPLFISFFYHFLGRVLGVVEISIIFMALVGEAHWSYALMLASLTSVTHLIFAFVPGGVGLIESLYGSFFSYFGLDPVLGFSMQLIRRLRTLFWVGVGMILLHRHKRQ